MTSTCWHLMRFASLGWWMLVVLGGRLPASECHLALRITATVRVDCHIIDNVVRLSQKEEVEGSCRVHRI